MAQQVTPPSNYHDDNFEQMVLRTIMKQNKVDEAEAQLIVETMKKKGAMEPLAKWMSTLGAYSDTLSRLPQESQKDFSAMIMSRAMMEESDNKKGGWLQEIIALKEAGVLGGSKSDEKMEALQKEIASLKETEQKRVFDDYKSFMEKKLADLESKIGMTSVPQNVEQDPVKKLASEITELQEKQKVVQSLVGVSNGGSNMDLVKAKEELANLGYKIEGPVTPAELERRMTQMQEKWQREADEKYRKMLEEERKSKENTQQTVDMFMQGLGVAIDAVSMFMPDAAKSTPGKLSELVKKARQVGAGAAQPVAPAPPTATATAGA